MQLTAYLFFHVVSACAQVLTNKFLVMHVHVLVFHIICSLTYVHTIIFVPVKQKISYLLSL